MLDTVPSFGWDRPTPSLGLLSLSKGKHHNQRPERLRSCGHAFGQSHFVAARKQLGKEPAHSQQQRTSRCRSYPRFKDCGNNLLGSAPAHPCERRPYRKRDEGHRCRGRVC